MSLKKKLSKKILFKHKTYTSLEVLKSHCHWREEICHAGSYDIGQLLFLVIPEVFSNFLLYKSHKNTMGNVIRTVNERGKNGKPHTRQKPVDRQNLLYVLYTGIFLMLKNQTGTLHEKEDEGQCTYPASTRNHTTESSTHICFRITILQKKLAVREASLLFIEMRYCTCQHIPKKLQGKHLA